MLFLRFAGLWSCCCGWWVWDVTCQNRHHSSFFLHDKMEGRQEASGASQEGLHSRSALLTDKLEARVHSHLAGSPCWVDAMAQPLHAAYQSHRSCRFHHIKTVTSPPCWVLCYGSTTACSLSISSVMQVSSHQDSDQSTLLGFVLWLNHCTQLINLIGYAGFITSSR